MMGGRYVFGGSSVIPPFSLQKYLQIHVETQSVHVEDPPPSSPLYPVPDLPDVSPIKKDDEEALAHPIGEIGFHVAESVFSSHTPPSHSDFMLELTPFVDTSFQTHT